MNPFANTTIEIVSHINEAPTFDYSLHTPVYQIEVVFSNLMKQKHQQKK